MTHIDDGRRSTGRDRAGVAAACALALAALTGCFHGDDQRGEGDGITERTNWTGVNDTPPAPTETDAQRSDPAGNEPVRPVDTE